MRKPLVAKPPINAVEIEIAQKHNTRNKELRIKAGYDRQIFELMRRRDVCGAKIDKLGAEIVALGGTITDEE